MKARTKTSNGEIFFCYEDYCGKRFRNWHEIARYGDGASYLIGYFYSRYWNGIQPIDELVLTGRPTVGMVKKFMADCKTFIGQ